MYGHKNITWKDNELCLNGRETGYSVVPYVELFKIQFPDGVLSQDYYNLTRARDNAARLYLEAANIAV